MSYTGYGASIRSAREAVGMEVKVVAAQAGMSETTYRRVERNERAVSIAESERISKAIGIEFRRILASTDSRLHNKVVANYGGMVFAAVCPDRDSGEADVLLVAKSIEDAKSQLEIEPCYENEIDYSTMIVRRATNLEEVAWITTAIQSVEYAKNRPRYDEVEEVGNLCKYWVERM